MKVEVFGLSKLPFKLNRNQCFLEVKILNNSLEHVIYLIFCLKFQVKQLTLKLKSEKKGMFLELTCGDQGDSKVTAKISSI